ncbi:Orf_111 [Bombyx mori nucleopolyhedrovirus]|nr:Orf_111 [Bombyx mori nucleopolyhedrovirus]AAC63801.1 Orf_111 [Bombyx mori nucleopolyhedrovirus]AIS92850.1 hypothetical protein Bm(Br)Orf-119 [Bombyx mori nucleopolyhedrovirus]BBA20617.1 hypothetical protein [Bombyx mori nucleopolyhedrovirus]
MLQSVRVGQFVDNKFVFAFKRSVCNPLHSVQNGHIFIYTSGAVTFCNMSDCVCYLWQRDNGPENYTRVVT